MGEVEFMGTGNAFSPNGRMHALTLIDGSILIDCPPTILPQFRKSEVGAHSISSLLFTHWHADHMFGFPFFILEREWMTPESETKEALEVYCRPGGRDILEGLCEIGFPGSLGDALKEISWNPEESGQILGTGWSFDRFPVIHTPETDPHGYSLIHESGLSLLHCGDSGPCDEIDKRAAESQVILVEMGVPDFVNSPNHHNPSNVIELARRNQHATILVTHNYAKSAGEEHGFDIPELPYGIVQLSDGDKLIYDDDGKYFLKIKNK